MITCLLMKIHGFIYNDFFFKIMAFFLKIVCYRCTVLYIFIV
jgi:hypothetical protein